MQSTMNSNCTNFMPTPTHAPASKMSGGWGRMVWRQHLNNPSCGINTRIASGGLFRFRKNYAEQIRYFTGNKSRYYFGFQITWLSDCALVCDQHVMVTVRFQQPYQMIESRRDYHETDEERQSEPGGYQSSGIDIFFWN